MTDLNRPTDTERLVESKLRTLASGAPPFIGFTAPSEATPSQGSRTRLAPLVVAASVAGIALGVTALATTDPRNDEASDKLSVSATNTTPSEGDSPLTDSETALAEHAAQAFVRRQDASITSATATAEEGTIAEPNTTGQCLSGRLLHIQLIGTFPKIVTTGYPVEAGSEEDLTVRAVDITADASSGSVCVITARTGNVAPNPAATPLELS